MLGLKLNHVRKRGHWWCLALSRHGKVFIIKSDMFPKSLLVQIISFENWMLVFKMVKITLQDIKVLQELTSCKIHPITVDHIQTPFAICFICFKTHYSIHSHHIGAIKWHRYESTLVQVMAYFLMASSLYLNQVLTNHQSWSVVKILKAMLHMEWKFSANIHRNFDLTPNQSNKHRSVAAE